MRNPKVRILLLSATLLIADILAGASFYFSINERVRDLEWMPSFLIALVIMAACKMITREIQISEDREEARREKFLDLGN